MVFLVTNCYDWVGFHIVNKLLETGYTVDGYDELSNEDNHLSMFLGRNSSFNFVKDIDVKDYNTSFIVLDGVPLHNLKSRQIIRLGHHLNYCDKRENLITIKKPLLFGKWMPMDEKGIYHNKAYISFQSNEFISSAIHINDYTNALLQWIRSSRLPSTIDIYSKHDKVASNKLLESTVFIRDNKPIKEEVNKLIAHYKQYTEFYV